MAHHYVLFISSASGPTFQGFNLRTTPFLPQTCERQVSPTQLHVGGMSGVRHKAQVHARARGKERVRSRGNSSQTLKQWKRKAVLLWHNSSMSEKIVVGMAALGAVIIAGGVVNTLFHVSLLLAFSIIPVFLAPMMIIIMASMSVFALLTFATAGAGFVFIGTPFFAIALLAKMLMPVLLIAGAAGMVVQRFLGLRSVADDEEYDEYEDDTAYGWEQDGELERFDKVLRKRSVGEKGWNVAAWGMSDVVDELDYTGLGEYRQLFIEERIDGRVLLQLTEEDIKSEFGTCMPLGDRMRLVRLVTDLRRRSSNML